MKVVYVYDALCGWCYGFSSEISQFHQKYKNSLGFEVISGGMVTGSRIGPIGEVAPYISWAYLEVEKTTGVKFGDEFLNKTLKNGTAIFSSIKPAIALSVVKSLKPELSMAFASALQKAIYFDGIEPENIEAYKNLAIDFGFIPNDFIQKMQDPVYLKSAEADFKKSAELGVQGFPSVFIAYNGVYYQVSSGYMPLHRFEKSIWKLINNIKKQ